jgi:hypothetical protein
MVRHQAIGPDPGPGGSRGARQQLAIDLEVVILEEGRPAPIAALGDVVRQAGDDEPGKAGDGRLLLSEQASI